MRIDATLRLCYHKAMMKRFLRRSLCGLMTLLLILLTGCADTPPDTLSFTAMDTVMSLTVYGSDCCERIRDCAAALDGELSAIDKSSAIFALNRDGTAALSPDAAALVRRTLALSADLGGALDPTVYPAVCAWGFTTGNYRVPDDAALAALAGRIDYSAVTVSGDSVTVPDGMMLDLGAVAKGFLADKAKEILRGANAGGAVLSLGGTILLYGQKPSAEPFTVGIADPDSPASYFGTLRLGEGVVATSGGYERYFERDGVRYIHILDPDTAKPVDNGVLSVTIFTDEGVVADALSTALFVMGADRAAQYYREHGGFEYVILTQNGALYLTEGLADRFTLCEGYGYEPTIIGREKE